MLNVTFKILGWVLYPLYAPFNWACRILYYCKDFNEVRNEARKAWRFKDQLRQTRNELDEVKTSRAYWRDKASSLRRQRRHLIQQLQTQT